MTDKPMTREQALEAALRMMLKGTQEDCGQISMPTNSAVRAAFAALALPVQTAKRVFLVATGEVYEGRETYERYEDSPPPLCDYEVLYTRGDFVPAPAVPESADTTPPAQPSREPMTEDDMDVIMINLGAEMKGLRCWGWMDLVRAVEAHHGITAGKEG